MRQPFRCFGTVSASLLCLLCLKSVIAQSTASGLFFDDFSYASTEAQAFVDNGWHVRTASGGPGIGGALWSADGVSVVADHEAAGNRLLKLRSASDGTAAGTTQTELFSQRRFLYGTYAARVHFSDAPTSGPDGQHLVASFFTISPLRYDLDPDYSELDFEYRPNGGWGAHDHVLSVTSWQTAAADETLWRNKSEVRDGSFAGWHTFVVQATGAAVDYFVDGAAFAHHVGRYVPVTPMSINFNLWFIGDDAAAVRDRAEYVEQIDWVFHVADETRSTANVEAQVDTFRMAQVAQIDTIPEP